MTCLSAVVDSCVIYPMPLCDTLLRAAEAELYQVYFSQEILDGATRNLVKKGRMTESKAERFQEIIKINFSEAMVEVPGELVEKMTNHPGDRHVAVAAIIAQSARFLVDGLHAIIALYQEEGNTEPVRRFLKSTGLVSNDLFMRSFEVALKVIPPIRDEKKRIPEEKALSDLWLAMDEIKAKVSYK